MIKFKIFFLLFFIFFFNHSIVKAQYHYTKLDTINILHKKFIYSHNLSNNLYKITAYTLIGGFTGLLVGEIFSDKVTGEIGLGIYFWGGPIVGAAIGLITGITITVIDILKRKNLGYDKEGLMKHFEKEDSFDNIILIAFALVSIGDKKEYQFLVGEYHDIIKAKLNKPPDNFIKSFKKVLAYAAVKNEYDLEPVLKSKLELEDKQEILNKIPFCINVVPVDTALYYLISEVEIQREEDYEKDVYLSDAYYEMLTAHLLTRRSEADFSELVESYNSIPGGKVKFWLGFALADYKYEGSIDYLIEMYNTSRNGNLRFYALQGLMNFDTDKVREVMKKALYDDYIPPNQVKSNKEERFIIRNLAEEYLENQVLEF